MELLCYDFGQTAREIISCTWVTPESVTTMPVVLGEDVWLYGVWKSVQAILHPLHSSAHTFRYSALPLPVLWQKVSPEVWHEETHLYTHWWVYVSPLVVLYRDGKVYSWHHSYDISIRNWNAVLFLYTSVILIAYTLLDCKPLMPVVNTCQGNSSCWNWELLSLRRITNTVWWITSFNTCSVERRPLQVFSVECQVFWVLYTVATQLILSRLPHSCKNYPQKHRKTRQFPNQIRSTSDFKVQFPLPQTSSAETSQPCMWTQIYSRICHPNKVFTSVYTVFCHSISEFKAFSHDAPTYLHDNTHQTNVRCSLKYTF